MTFDAVAARTAAEATGTSAGRSDAAVTTFLAFLDSLPRLHSHTPAGRGNGYARLDVQSAVNASAAAEALWKKVLSEKKGAKNVSSALHSRMNALRTLLDKCLPADAARPSHQGKTRASQRTHK